MPRKKQPNKEIEAALKYAESKGWPKQPVFALKDESESAQFRERLVKTLQSKKILVKPILVGKTPDVLQKLGAKDLPLTIRRDVVRKAINGIKRQVPKHRHRTWKTGGAIPKLDRKRQA